MKKRVNKRATKIQANTSFYSGLMPNSTPISTLQVYSWEFYYNFFQDYISIIFAGLQSKFSWFL